MAERRRVFGAAYVVDVWEETRKYMIIIPGTALSQAAVFAHAVSSLSSLSQLTFS